MTAMTQEDLWASVRRPAPAYMEFVEPYRGNACRWPMSCWCAGHPDCPDRVPNRPPLLPSITQELRA